MSLKKRWEFFEWKTTLDCLCFIFSMSTLFRWTFFIGEYAILVSLYISEAVIKISSCLENILVSLYIGEHILWVSFCIGESVIKIIHCFVDILYNIDNFWILVYFTEYLNEFIHAWVHQKAFTTLTSFYLHFYRYNGISLSLVWQPSLSIYTDQEPL